ncbi:MAG TPA: hypothetical protein PLS53_01755 [Thermoanaerobaculaceae bacterium]|nr:hypothetical protein [Thermoanaerobaculaceae bacterium]HPS76861.1 hypothetical protein [Thermoanaerobaculaceae bacterium]
MDNESPNGLASVWKEQPVQRAEVSLDQLRLRSRKLDRRVWWRNLREYAASVAVIGTFGYYIWRFPAPMVRLGCALVVAGVLFMVHSLHTRGAARTVPTEMAFRSCLEFHREQLERQRDLLRGVWRWYLLPLVPGMAVFLFGLLLWTLEQPHAPAHTRAIVITFFLTAVACGLVFVGIGKLNQWAARKLQREIDALDALGRES